MNKTKTRIFCYSALVIGVGLFYLIIVEGFMWRYYAQKKASESLNNASTPTERKEASGRFGMSAEYDNGDWLIIYYERHTGFRTSKSLGLALGSDGIWHRSNRDYHRLFHTALALKRYRDDVRYLLSEGYADTSELTDFSPHDRNEVLALSILESTDVAEARKQLEVLGFTEFNPE